MLRRHTVRAGGVVAWFAPLERAAAPVPLPAGEVFNDWVVVNDPAIPLTWRRRASTVRPMFSRSSSESYQSSPEG